MWRRALDELVDEWALDSLLDIARHIQDDNPSYKFCLSTIGLASLSPHHNLTKFVVYY